MFCETNSGHVALKWCFYVALYFLGYLSILILVSVIAFSSLVCVHTIYNFIYKNNISATVNSLKQIPEWCLDFWHPSEKAMYPDYFAKREQWKKLQQESWEKEVSACSMQSNNTLLAREYFVWCLDVFLENIRMRLQSCLDSALLELSSAWNADLKCLQSHLRATAS